MSDSIQSQLQTKIQSELGIESNGKFEKIIGDVMSTYIAAQIAPLQQQIDALKNSNVSNSGSLSSGSIHIVKPTGTISSGSGGTNAGGGSGNVDTGGSGGSGGTGAGGSLKQT